ncbi:MAG TPA: DUF4124 domain-containing protein [Steroidobacteraceae bacterium]|nr:DUF4124 domain-containing protein [Steroidobacteraceae bacterium]
MTMRTFLFTLMCLAAPLVLAATVYKWVDENGVVHYSDQPHPNAEKVQVQAVQTYKAGAMPSGDSAAAAAAKAPKEGYAGCAVSDPADDQTYTNVDAVTIAVRTDPALRPGDQIYIMLDGTLVNNGSATGNSYTVSPVERGTHTVQAVEKNSEGGLMCQSPGITFHVHLPSIQNPVNPVRPH